MPSFNFEMMRHETDVLIIGGGLAGLTSALHLHKKGFHVLLIEKQRYPHHKVCGEYVSNEVLPYLNWLDIHIDDLTPSKIDKLEFTTLSGKRIQAPLPSGGFGISRFAFDHFLYQKLVNSGVEVLEDTVTQVDYDNESFLVETQSKAVFNARYVIGAYGKRSLLDKKLTREFIFNKSPFLAVKAHYKGQLPSDLVGLHHFEGGYCGVSMVENGRINICYLTDYETFKRYKSLEAYQQSVLHQNSFLKQILEQSQMIWDTPLTISQLSFGRKETVVNHMLMIGDTAGLIHPLCGNGMAMAIHSAQICSNLVVDHHHGKIKSRKQLEQCYTKAWNKNFRSRMQVGKLLSYVLRHKNATRFLFNMCVRMPSILNGIIKKTHGKPLTIPV